MANGILIIEQAPAMPGAGANSLLPPLAWDNARVSWEALIPDRLRAGANSLLIANTMASSAEAQEFFHWVRENPISIPLLAVLPEDDPELLHAAAEAADDFLIWPVRADELNKRIGRLLGSASAESINAEMSLVAELGLNELVGKDPAFVKVLEQIVLFGGSDAPLLMTGETGTGKELCARVVHLLSRRARGPFIPVDCGTLPDHLFENEIFGHARGAFTDARSDQKGLVALAQGGTLFIDEIDSLSLSAQSKLLRFLQEHTYRSLGAERFSQADVRIIAATNRDLEEMAAQKQFRSDLFFRINVLRIRLPALRERRADILLLSRFFIERICKGAGILRKVLSQAAAQRLEAHSWPGNIRELYNIVQRAVLCSPGAQIAAAAIDLPAPCSAIAFPSLNFRRAKLNAIASFERDYVTLVMKKHDGNVTRAAREAGKDRRAFGRLVKKYGISLAPK